MDIFFVISGLLITAILVRDLEAGGFSYDGARYLAPRPAPQIWRDGTQALTATQR